MAEAMSETKSKAENLLRLAKWHKRHCHDESCNVSLYMLGETYEEILGRELTKEEGRIFL